MAYTVSTSKIAGMTLKDRIRLKLFLGLKLPAAFWSGIRLIHLEKTHAVVEIKHSWRNQNPFRSIYFACLAMAAEFSTGVLAHEIVKASGHPFSMLVIGLNANFTKKATGRIRFTCQDGAAFEQVLKECINSGEPRTLDSVSIGVDEAGDPVAQFTIQWSFKCKSTKVPQYAS